MKVKVILELDREEVDDYRKEWMEDNPGEISDEEIKETYLEWFWADKHEYLCSADIDVQILTSMKQLCIDYIKELK